MSYCRWVSHVKSSDNSLPSNEESMNDVPADQIFRLTTEEAQEVAYVSAGPSESGLPHRLRPMVDKDVHVPGHKEYSGREENIIGKVKKTKKYAEVKRRLSLKDSRIKPKDREKAKIKKPDPQNLTIRELPQASSALFFRYNTQLGPPYHVLVDTNFINFSIKNKLDIIPSMMDCLYAKCIPYITDCVMAELEKLGAKYRVALRIVKDPRFERLSCMHKGTYADDCLVQRITQHKCYIVATCDKDLKRRIRKVPGVPIMYLQQRRYSIERMPDAFGAPKT